MDGRNNDYKLDDVGGSASPMRLANGKTLLGISMDGSDEEGGGEA